MKSFYGIVRFWLHWILVYDSMSTIGIWVLRTTPASKSHFQRPLLHNIERNWELRATPLWREPPPESQFYWGMGVSCYALVLEPPPKSLSLYISPLGCIIVHICLWGMFMVFMRWWPLGPATSMPIIWLFFHGYTWIEIIHDSEGSLIMDHGFDHEALLYDFTDIGSL